MFTIFLLVHQVDIKDGETGRARESLKNFRGGLQDAHEDS